MSAMSDRELLELAAKASGIEISYWGHTGFGIIRESDVRCIGWNPLVDDGDALRLAVKLQLDIEFINGDTLVLNVSNGGGDPNERTRWAIVRAAAEIGKAMP